MEIIIQCNVVLCIYGLCVLICRSCLKRHISPEVFKILWILGYVGSILLSLFKLPYKLFGLFHISDVNVIDSVLEENYLSYKVLEKTANSGIRFVPLLIICIGISIFIIQAAIYFYDCLKIERNMQKIKNLDQWKARHKTFINYDIYKIDGIKSPVTVGFFRQKILIPKNIEDEKEKLLLILEHEWMHICKCDSFIKLLCLFISCLCWFNPIVWIMLNFLNRDIECCCDRAVIYSLGDEIKRVYSTMLLEMSLKNKRIILGTSQFIGKSLRERVEIIGSMRKSRKDTRAISILVLCGALMLLIVSSISLSPKDYMSISKENYWDSTSAGPVTRSYYSAEEYQDLINELESNRDSIILGSSLTAEEFDENIQVMRKVLQEIEAGITVVYKNDERWDENESSYAVGLSRSEFQNDVSVVGFFSNMSSVETDEYTEENVDKGVILENETQIRNSVLTLH